MIHKLVRRRSGLYTEVLEVAWLRADRKPTGGLVNVDKSRMDRNCWVGRPFPEPKDRFAVCWNQATVEDLRNNLYNVH